MGKKGGLTRKTGGSLDLEKIYNYEKGDKIKGFSLLLALFLNEC